ncbi:MAG: hypothetical protein KDD25_08805, partial [Bdellovibrionales bacterium]|nr:hypothetical protein [Bdellovibrionales bacterium]
MKFTVSTFYKFFPMTESEVQETLSLLEPFANEMGMRGLFLLGKEGVNATVAGTPDAILKFKDKLQNETLAGSLHFKDSECDFLPF